MNSRICLFTFLLCAAAHTLQAQTVGLFFNDSASYNGYTLFSPTSYRTSYLIDNCGELINSWDSEFNAGQIAYLLEDGSLLRVGRVTSSFNGGGSGGFLERYNWEGERTWSYLYSNSVHHQHHDIEVLPNGNILILAWELHTESDAIQSGRDPDKVASNGMWSEQIVEIRPIGNDSAEIVWEWHAWDHLVQDFDSTQANYAQIVDHPELIDLNYTEITTGVDWIHANSVDYNASLDQIMINSRNFSEFWIIDHSTSTEESEGHVGGNHGKGGDLLYRWGNPRTFHRGTESDAIFYLQHDAHWIPEGRPDAGKVMVFNNGAGRPGGSYSSIDIVVPTMDSSGAYPIDIDAAFGPDSLFWSYDGGEDNSFYAQRVSGAERMANGNTLICVGILGEFFEINPEEEIIWKYRSPISRNGPVAQGLVPSGRDVFRAYRYHKDYSGLAGRDLIPMGPLELDPLPSDCVIYGDSIISGTEYVSYNLDCKIFPNPVFDHFTIETDENSDLLFDVISSSGIQMLQRRTLMPGAPVLIDDWSPGMYFIRIVSRDFSRQSTYKVVKL